MAYTTARGLTDSIQGHLSLELTTRCNCDCRHCFARAGLSEEATLDPALVETICEEGFHIGYRRLHLTGGEPLLWPDLWDLLEKVFTLGYHSVFLNTNGLLLDRATASRLARYKGLSLSVSLEESREWHDALRGPGTYRCAAEGIACAVAAGVPLRIFTVIGKTLLTRLSAFVDAVAQKFPGIEGLTLIEITGDPAALGDLSRELMAPDDFVRMVRTISVLNLCGFITAVLNDPLVNVAADLMQLPYVPPSGALCRPGKLVIRADRRMTLAHSTRESFGTYSPGALAKVLTGRDYRKAVGPDNVTCPTCRYRFLCHRHGMRQPSIRIVDREPGPLFCQRVLGCIDTSVERHHHDKRAAPTSWGADGNHDRVANPNEEWRNIMPGILDFMTDVSADGTLAADFAKKASEDCTAADLKAFFQTHGYPDVTDADVEKILAQKENIKQDFRVPEGVDY